MIDNIYTLNTAIFLAEKNGYNFLTSMECKEEYFDEGETKTRNRKFVIWDSPEEYLKNKKNNCHELVTSVTKSRGRLVFDFDIPYDKYPVIPENFKEDIQKLILNIFDKYYTEFDLFKVRFVWLTSKNDKKLSKHLIVKGAYFCDNWSDQMKIFYRLMKKESLKYIDWIEPCDLIDFQVARKNGSMRLPLNSKLGGSSLLFDDPTHKFVDGLIYPCSKHRRTEQRVSISNCIFKGDIIPKRKEFKGSISENRIKKSYCLIEKKLKGMFIASNLVDNILQLKRIKPGKCLISGKFHENDNACIIFDKKDFYFYCHRRCSDERKTIKLSCKPRPTSIVPKLNTDIFLR